MHCEGLLDKEDNIIVVSTLLLEFILLCICKSDGESQVHIEMFETEDESSDSTAFTAEGPENP